MRVLAIALALLCSGCASFWTYDEADYFADLARYTPAAASAPMPRTTAAAPAPASRLPDPVVIEEPREVDFACADGSRLRLSYSEDRRIAVARWNDETPISMDRADQDGVTRYVSSGASFFRAGRRIAWDGAGDIEVREGDTLWKISERVLGTRDRGMEIAALNRDRIADPNLIYPGQRLRTPGGQRRFCARPLTAQAM